MISLRLSHQRGLANFGWLHSRHSFSFGNYYDPAHMGYRSLRVINEDQVEPGQGFGAHPHRDMEILTYVLEGALEHADSMGNGRVVKPGELQYMSAGRGVTHSEHNAGKTEPVHFLQIWIQPDETGVEPRYGEWKPNGKDLVGLTLLASPDGADDSVAIRQNARLYLGKLASGQSAEFTLPEGHGAWLQVMRGSVEVLGETLQAGDGASIVDEPQAIALKAADNQTEFLLFDLE